MSTLMLTISAGLFVFFALLFALSLVMRHKIEVNNRIKTLFGEMDMADKPSRKEKVKKRSHLPISQVLVEELSSAGIRMRPEEYLLIWGFLAIVPGVIMILAGVHSISIIAAVILGLILPPILVQRKKKKQLDLFEKQLGDALMLIGNCLRSGLTFQQAMVSISKEMKDPIAREFAITVKEVQLGTNLDVALANMQRRVKSAELMLAVSAVQIQHQVGGNLMEILRNISETIIDRQKIKDDIKVLTATGRTSGVIVGLLPAALGGILMLINPEYIQTFFNTQIGTIMLIVAAIMELIGFLLIKKTITIKY